MQESLDNATVCRTFFSSLRRPAPSKTIETNETNPAWNLMEMGREKKNEQVLLIAIDIMMTEKIHLSTILYNILGRIYI